MSGAVHTPGPWRVGAGPRGMTGPTTARPTGPTVVGHRWKSVSVTHGQDTVAIVPACANQQVGDCEQDLPQMRANAHLIAAAPELLEALEWVESTGMCEHGGGGEMIRAAIAKAKGIAA